MNWLSLTDIPQLSGPLSVFPITANEITVSWTAPQSPPTSYILTSYILTSVCTLLCNDSLLDPSVTPTTSSSTSATYFNLLPGSKCNFTLAAEYGYFMSNELMVTATTLSESEQTINVHVLLWPTYFSMFFSTANRTIGSTHWLCYCVREQLICHPDME